MLSKDFFKTREVAALCNVSSATIFRAIVKNRLKAATTPGGHFRVARPDLEKFLKRNHIALPVAETSTKRILIVEDNVLERRAFQRILSSDPVLDLKSTGLGYEAGFLTQSFKPHLILLDIFLLDLDGRQILKLVRADKSLSKTKIVVVTGAKDPADLKEIKSLKPDAFLSKPVSAGTLRDVVASLLK